MKYSKVMKERIRRVTVLFRELGCELFDEEKLEESYSSAFLTSTGLQGFFYIERDNRFLEIAYNFAFSPQLSGYLQRKMSDVLEACFEYGCYMNAYFDDHAVGISLFSKIYFSGLNYSSLRDTLVDFYHCTDAIKEVVSLKKS
ncbi:MAG: hypothetical protein SVR04_10965 [Spirochaetota bacterium]|nr:hypothetical protein [Spirochaetota bacterium]